MHKFILSFFILVISADFSIAQQCFRLAHQRDDIYSENQQFEIDDAYVTIGNEREPITSTRTLMFYDYLRVKAFFKCRFDFAMIQEEDVHLLTEIDLKNQTNPIYLITSDSTDLAYIVLDDQPYLVTDCDNTSCYDTYLYNDELEVEGIFKNETYSNPQASYITTYETIEETVLLKSQHFELEEIPPQFTLAKKEIITRQQGICPEYEYVYTTVIDSFVSKESYNHYVIHPATFETRSEEILVKEGRKAFSDAVIKEARLQEEVILVAPHYNTWQASYDSITSSIDPFNTIDLDLITIPEVRDTLDVWKYDGSCPEGYDDKGSVCTKTTFIPSEYETRFYEKLNTHATSTSIYKPSQYTYYEKTFIQNIDTIPPDCITETRDSVSYEKLVSPSTVEIDIIPAEYETRTYEKLLSQMERITVSSTEIDKIKTYRQKRRSSNQSDLETICFDRLDAALIDRIVLALQSKGVEIESKDYPTSLFWHPLLSYQSQQNLPIGRIDSGLIKHLNIQE